jgi:hypothetical protein
MALTPKRTRPYTPRTNGKGTGVIKTLMTERAYTMAFQTSDERNWCIPPYQSVCNGRRLHMALMGRTPIEQLGWL